MEKNNVLEAQESLLGEEGEYIPSIQRQGRIISNRSYFTSLNIAILVLNLLGIVANLKLSSLWRSDPVCESQGPLIYCRSIALQKWVLTTDEDIQHRLVK